MRARLERIARACAITLVTSLALCSAKAGESLLVATPVGPERVIFQGPAQGCDAIDIPDAPLRAYRLADGRIAAFGLHHENRRLVGKSLETLKIECPVVFRGKGDANPAALDDRIWITATHTKDGQSLFALGHAEYHGEAHPGRCTAAEPMKCLWVGTIALQSKDGGASFTRLPSPVAVPGQRAEEDQTRHRGFFNPTNIVEHNGTLYTLIAQMGWPGQPYGVCAFRAAKPEAGWLAFDGKGFKTSFPSPYTPGFKPAGICQPLAPFPMVPGSITKHRASGQWLALFPAYKGTSDRRGGTFAASGFYLAASRNLIDWSAPTLVLAGPLLGESPCGQAAILAYPALIDPASGTRNFEDVGDVAELAYTRIATRGCDLVHDRAIVLRRVRITAAPVQ